VPDSRPLRLTDELERQLMRQAIEEQFRPRPLRALGRLLKNAVRRTPGSQGVAGAGGIALQSSSGRGRVTVSGPATVI